VTELSNDELASVSYACSYVAVPDPPPHYLRRFVVLRLHRADPRLAEKVARLDAEQCAGLLRAVHSRQCVTAHATYYP
jgi:hypothetical protein